MSAGPITSRLIRFTNAIASTARRRLLILVSLLTLTLMMTAGLLMWATSAYALTPTIDGVISAGEYGNHNSGQNAQTSGPGTWYMTWDDNNLYVGITGANIGEGAVLYIDKDPLATPNGGTNANGNLTGQPYDNTNLTPLPFRADFVTYFKSGYREYRTATGTGTWSGPTAGYGTYAENGGTNTRELAIPWSSINSGGKPASFNFFGYVTSNTGFVFAQVPTQNPGGTIGTSNSQYQRYYRVSNTHNTTGTPPFSQNVATFVVNSTADTGDAGTDGICGEPGVSTICTLREAIQEANAVPVPSSYDTITFNIGTGLQTITPASLLPDINDPVRIDGTTQPGYAGTPIIQLTGQQPNFGLTLNTNNSTVMGLVINGFGGAIYIIGGTGNLIQGNYIGTNPTGTSAVPNAGGILLDNAPNNTVGGTTAAARNLISGNSGPGVNIVNSGSTGNLIQGNYIGTNAAGTSALPNGTGIILDNAPNNTIGGTAAGAGNLISGNTGAGVDVVSGTTGTLLQGNYIGTNAAGTGA
ncbi:MAG: CSLREA domain-containing protein, partial [Chloroflexota bacterium]|nr:CSLREA domain-containing protein [Chloroflexota bacterium]